MIINAQYFQSKELYIPNAVAQPSIGSVSPSALVQLENEIESIEQSLLLDALGYAQLTELMAQFEANGDWKPTADQKWKDLVDGKENWRGLRYTVGTQKRSLIAYYVFFHYLGTDYQTYSTTGMQIAESENAVRNDPSIKQVTIWNKFIAMYIGNGRNGRSIGTTSNWNGVYLPFDANDLGNDISLYQFLAKNKDVYDVNMFTNKTPINYAGL
jgi:hypothetical protein